MINKSKVLRTIALFLGTSYLSVTYAQLDQYGLDTPTPENPIVNDEYVIYFNEPKGGEIPIVWKADREANLRRQVPVPFGQHSTGQSIPGLEKQLGLNGKILHILDAMNGIHVRMTAD